MLAAQQALETETVEVVRNGITIVITGHQRVQSITVDPKHDRHRATRNG